MLAKLGANHQKSLILLLLGAVLLTNGCTVSHTKKTEEAKDTGLEEVKPSQPETKKKTEKAEKAKKRRTVRSSKYDRTPHAQRGEISEETIVLPKRIPADVEFTETLDIENVYFDFDSSGLTGTSRVSLTKQVDKLKSLSDKFPNLMILIEGHCDERGTNEYNLALGERRSAGVRDYLISLGVPSRIMYIKTWGEERPVADGHSEEVWAKNRRVEFKVSGIDNSTVGT